MTLHERPVWISTIKIIGCHLKSWSEYFDYSPLLKPMIVADETDASKQYTAVIL